MPVIIKLYVIIESWKDGDRSTKDCLKRKIQWLMGKVGRNFLAAITNLQIWSKSSSGRVQAHNWDRVLSTDKERKRFSK